MHVIDQPQAKSSAYKIAASVNDGLFSWSKFAKLSASSVISCRCFPKPWTLHPKCLAYEIALVLQEFTGEMIVCEKSCVLVCWRRSRWKFLACRGRKHVQRDAGILSRARVESQCARAVSPCACWSLSLRASLSLLTLKLERDLLSARQNRPVWGNSQHRPVWGNSPELPNHTAQLLSLRTKSPCSREVFFTPGEIARLFHDATLWARFQTT